MNMIKQINSASIKLSAIGQGMGDYSWDESQIEVLRAGIDLGMTFIDTAESYTKGRSEEIIGKAVKELRDKVIIGTKIAPEHHSKQDIVMAVEGSLKRLQTDYIDLYQIHWPNPAVPLEETMSVMEDLVEKGKIRYIGLGNFYLKDIKEAQTILKSQKVSSLQTEYNLFDRTIENNVLPYCYNHDIFVIAYSPLDQGRIADGSVRKKTLDNISQKYNKTPSQITLRWLIDKPHVIVIPKAKNVAHLKSNAEAANFDLEECDVIKIDNLFRRPVINVSPDRIRVVTQGQNNRMVYQRLEEAIENKLQHVPSPVNLAKSISKEEYVKPVRLIQTLDKTGRYDYDLVEGRIRFWAWVIAYKDKPIPALLREDWG